MTRVVTGKEAIFFKNLGNIIFNLRKSRGVSYAQVAKYLAITVQQLYKYEEGSNRISLYKLNLLSKLFKIDVLDYVKTLLESDDYSNVSTVNKSKRFAAMSNNLAKIENPKYQKVISKLIKSLAELEAEQNHSNIIINEGK